MAKIRDDGKAGVTYHKIQRGAAIAAGTSGYMDHVSKKERERRMSIYYAIMDAEEKKMMQEGVKI